MDAKGFREFAHEAVHASMKLNKLCQSEYKIGDCKHWDYRLQKGILVFSSSGKPQVVASIQVVGTTSTEQKNWMWGWANKSMPKKVIQRMKIVKEFGKREGVPQLTRPTLSDNEFLGWKMTSVATRILKAKGSYRCPVEDGFVYVLFTDIRYARKGDEKLLEDEDLENRIECDTHGKAWATYICEHLAKDSRQKWFSDSPSESMPWPDAWCAKCDKVFMEQGEWKKSNAGRMNIKLICHLCYEFRRKGATNRN